jgi:regulator of replication initiation timing
MRFYWFVLLAALFVGSAQAQQPAMQSTIQQLMVNDANIKAALAEQLDAARKQAQELTVENTKLKVENEALKKAQSKPEAKKP